jgi:hypothetical protein
MAGLVSINVRSNAKALGKQLDDFVQKQLPFAIAQGINRTAARIAEAEAENIKQTFPRATPFTQKSVAIKRARKGMPIAVISLRDIAASYLQPYETGGVHKLSSRALLNPKNIRLNQYGQLPRGALAALKGRPDIFIGAVTTSSGETINGVWQRPTDTKKVGLIDRKGKRVRKLHKLDANANGGRGHLKLLIRFGDALPVTKQLNWGKQARQIVDRFIDQDMSAALATALATAR